MKLKKDDIIEIPTKSGYHFAPCIAQVSGIRNGGFITVRIDGSERDWIVEAKDVKKKRMDKRPYF